MNFFDVLAAEKWDGGVPTINFFDLLFAQSMGGGEQWQVYDGTLPATFNANGADMRQYQIFGNSGGVGDRTENIYNTNETTWSANGTFLDHNGNPTSAGSHYTTNFTAAKPETAYYLSGAFRSGVSTNRIYFYDDNKSWISRSAQIDTASVRTFTTPANCKFIQIQASNDVRSTADWHIKEGATPPETFVPYGYEVDMGVKSRNWFDYRDYVAEYYINNSGVETKAARDPANQSVWLSHSDYITISPDESYTMSAHHQNMSTGQTVAIAWYDENKIFILRDSTLIPKKNAGSYSFTATAPQNAKFAIFNFFTDDVQKVIFNPGTTPLDEYQPYYNTAITIYIGDEPLGKDEYIDYQAGKIYRMINGVLTPTDPPVPFPALPTCEGETIVDFVGQSVAPEKVLLEYAKGGN